MNLSGILVSTAPARTAEVEAAIAALPWAEVHHRDEGGRLICVVEGPDTETEIVRLKEVRRLPGVLAAEMVVHYFPDEAQHPQELIADAVPAYLDTDADDPGGRSHYSRLKALGNH